MIMFFAVVAVLLLALVPVCVHLTKAPAARETLPGLPAGVVMPEPFTKWVGIEQVEISPGADIRRWKLTLRSGAPADVETAFEHAAQLDDALSGIGGFEPEKLISFLVINYPKP